jgi:uncharacterized protein YdhG (YjbR/CyaY superfamily)
MKRSTKPSTIDDYLSDLTPDKRAALQRLRKTIHAIVPRAEETISYGIPAFRLDGRLLVWFAAAAGHCSFFPGGVVQDFKDELKGYSISKGTLRFDPEEGLPASLVRKLIKAKIAKTATKDTRGKSRRRPRT